MPTGKCAVPYGAVLVFGQLSDRLAGSTAAYGTAHFPVGKVGNITF